MGARDPHPLAHRSCTLAGAGPSRSCPPSRTWAAGVAYIASLTKKAEVLQDPPRRAPAVQPTEEARMMDQRNSSSLTVLGQTTMSLDFCRNRTSPEIIQPILIVLEPLQHVFHRQPRRLCGHWLKGTCLLLLLPLLPFLLEPSYLLRLKKASVLMRAQLASTQPRISGSIVGTPRTRQSWTPSRPIQETGMFCYYARCHPASRPADVCSSLVLHHADTSNVQSSPGKASS